MTYSIIARDPGTGSMGVAVQSHHFGAGPVVAWGEAGVGVVATQAIVDVGYGPRGLDRLRPGGTAPQVLAELVAADPLAAIRQVAMLDAAGGVAVHTGAGCVSRAGHRTGVHVSAQANMVFQDSVWPAMLDAYEASDEPDLAGRLCAALEAAEREGGDIRGRQSAAVLVVGGQRSERPWEQRLVDLQVDDHPDPLAELRRLLGVQRAAAVMGAVLASGILYAPSVSMHDAAPALAQLDDAQAALGDNREPSFWAAILLAKAGEIEQARVRLAHAAEANDRWGEFARRVAAAGVLPTAVAEQLAG